MKILYLSTWFPYPPDNGSKLRVNYLLKALGQAHEVTLVAFAFGSARPGQAISHSPVQNIIPIPANPFQRGSFARYTRFFSLTPIVEKPLPIAQETIKPLTNQSYDVIISASTMMAGYALSLSAKVRVLEEHNLMTQVAYERLQKQASPLGKLQARISWTKQKWYDKRVFSRFHHCTMVSKLDKMGAEQLTNTPITVIPNGVDCDWNRPGLFPIQPYRLVYNGSLTYQANFDAMHSFLRDIYPLIRAKQPEVTLHITGSTENVPLEQLAIDDSVTFTGHVADIREVVAGADVCVVPLREGGGSRLKILEAMALGTPVVATEKGAEGLEVVPGRDILIAHTPENFAQQTLELLNDRTLHQSLTINARQFVETNHDWTKIGRTFLDLVESLAQ